MDKNSEVSRTTENKMSGLFPLLDPSVLPLLSSETVVTWGRTMVVAPHPDDESLGCGGAIALLKALNCGVHILVMTDGTQSHPNSPSYPAMRLRELRERETELALARLGVTSDEVTFLSFFDRSLPHPAVDANVDQNFSFEKAVTLCRKHIASFLPQTVVLPWRRDPHPDHRATWQIINAAIGAVSVRPRCIEYPIWIWAMDEGGDAPRADEVAAWRLDITPVAARKQSAIAAHASQCTDLIKDDPSGFRLSADMLAHFALDWETYLEWKQ